MVGLLLDILISYQWEIFISIEILSIVALILFGVVRYFFDKRRISLFFIGVFLGLLALEAGLAWLIFHETGQISTFQIVIAVFLIYACTFGILDFLKLDRWMRKTIGGLRGVELLTEKDNRMMERNRNPKYLAKKNRWSATVHLIVFVTVQAVFWMYGTEDLSDMLSYVRDLSWIEEGTAVTSPYPNEPTYAIGMIWGIVFIVDFLWSWSYTFFPSQSKN